MQIMLTFMKALKIFPTLYLYWDLPVHAQSIQSNS